MPNKTAKALLTKEQATFLGWVLGLPGVSAIASMVFLSQYIITKQIMFLFFGVVWLLLDILLIINAVSIVFGVGGRKK